MKFGTHTIPSVILPYKDSGANVRVMHLQITDETDIQEVEWINRPGEDSAPPLGSKILIIEIGDDYKLGIACDDGIEPVSLDGENLMYSVDPTGAQAGYVKLGIVPPATLELNGNVDNAVRYSKLEDAFNDLQSKYNDLVTVFLAHIHNDSLGAPTTAPTPPIPPLPTAQQSTKQILLAKVLEVLLP